MSKENKKEEKTESYTFEQSFCENCKSYNRINNICNQRKEKTEALFHCNLFEIREFDEIEIKEYEAITKEEYQKKQKLSLPVNVYQDDKIRSSEEFYERKPFFYDETGLFWFWNNIDKCYEIVDETTLMNNLRKQAKNSIIIKNKEWGEIKRSMKLVGRDNVPEEVPKSWIQFKDKIIDWKTQEETQISHKYWNTNTIPWKCKKGNTPKIDMFFEQWVGKENVQKLKEIIAYCMIQDYPLHRIFCLTGSGLNGKGVFQTLLRKVIGEKNVVSTELDLLMDNRFESAKLYKKLVCQMGETNFSEISKTSMLKKLSGQDLVGIEFKNKNPFDTVNYAKMIINSNSLPPTMDKTDGFYRRWMIIDFPNKFKEGVDVISQIPDEEIEFLCGQCVELVDVIIKRGRFFNEGDIQERRKKYEEKSNPINSFIEEYYKKDQNERVPIFKFEDHYNSYLSDRGLRTMNRNSLTRLLRSNGFDIERDNVDHNGKRTKWTFIYGLSTVETLETHETANLTQHPYIESKRDSLSQVSQVSQSPLDFIWNFFISSQDSFYEEQLERTCISTGKMSKQTFIDCISKLKNEKMIFEPKYGILKKVP